MTPTSSTWKRGLHANVLPTARKPTSMPVTFARPAQPVRSTDTVFQLSQEIGCVCVRWSAPALTVIVAS